MPPKPRYRCILRIDRPPGVSPITIRRWAVRAAGRLRLPTGEIIIAFVDQARSRELNRRYRHRDRPTNVLTFHYRHHHTAGDELPTGEIVISPSIVRQEAGGLKQSYGNYLRYIIHHGLIHLTGRDHLTVAAERRWDAIAASLE